MSGCESRDFSFRVGIMRFHMLEGVKAVQRLYKMRTLILVRDLPRMLYIGAQKVNKPN